VLSAVLMLAGGVLLLIGCIMFIVNAFKVSVVWGLGVILLAPIGLVFLFKNWRENKTSFLLQLAGLVLVVVGALIGRAVATP